MQAVRKIGPFDYAVLPPQQQVVLKTLASDIADNATMIVKNVERIGQHLIAAKAMLEPEGQWLNWLGSIGLGHSSASNYMNVATHWGGTDIVEMTDLAPLFVISTSRVKEDVRQDFAALVKRGEKMDAEVTKVLRDAPAMLRARYVMGTLSKEQFVGLVNEFTSTSTSTRKGALTRQLIDEQVTDPAAVDRLSKLGEDALEVAVNTGHVNFDDRPVPVEKITKELLEMHRWQTQPPKDDEPAESDGDPNPPLLKAKGRVVSCSENQVAILFDVDAEEILQEGLTYTFTVR